MNINDIPLPSTPSKNNNLFDVSKGLDNKDNHASSSRIFPVKRHINKLPVGVLKKTDDSKMGDLLLHRKELFLPTMNDKIQLAMSNLNPVQSKKLEMLLNATKIKPIELNSENKINHTETSNLKNKRVDEKVENRKRKQNNNLKEPKKQKLECRSHDNEKLLDRHKNDDQDNRVVMKSQVVVKRSVNKLTDSKNKLYDHSNDKRNNHYEKSNSSPRYHGQNRHHHYQDYHQYNNYANNEYKRYKPSFVEPISNYSRTDHKYDNSHKTAQYRYSTNRNDSRHRKRSRTPIWGKMNNNHRHHDSETFADQSRGRQSREEHPSVLPSKGKRWSASTEKSSSISSSSSSSSSGSSSSGSSSSHGSSTSNNDVIELPMVSPNSPDDDNRIMDSIKDSKTANVTATTAEMANNCLKELSATLVRMNLAYKSVYSKIPNHRNEEEKLSNIPLPVPKEKSDTNFFGPKISSHRNRPSEGSNHKPIVIMRNGTENGNIETDLKNQMFGVPDRPRTTSGNADNLSHITRTSFGSKNVKSPYYSLNVSNTSKDSEFSDLKLRPLVPKISKFSIDYTNIDLSIINEINLTNNLKNFIGEMRCCCSIPNPDDWRDGVRSCSSGQNCILAQLKIECDNRNCPTDSLCCNTQFLDLESKSNKSFNIEFFFDVYQSIPWKIRAKKPIEKNKLIFEVAGIAEMCTDIEVTNKDSSTLLFISEHITINIRKDAHSYMNYLNFTQSKDQSNVEIEKWIAGGQIRLGVFATKDLQSGDELIVYLPHDYRVGVVYNEPILQFSDRSHVLECIQCLLHEPVSHQFLLLVLDTLLACHEDPSILQYFVGLGGPAVLCRLCDTLSSADSFEKLINLLVLVPYSDRKQLEIFGFYLQDYLNDLSSRINKFLPPNLDFKEKLQELSEKMSSISIIDSSISNRNELEQMKNASNSDILHCRLPPFWVSKECVYKDEYRVFFYHRLTKVMQWEMPVYPWEGNDDNDVEIYDYNLASQIQVSHDEIQQMYVNLNKIYEMKQKKLQAAKVNVVVKRKKESQEIQKKETFKRKIMAVIINLLKPYRDSSCTEGKIESDEDLNYLTNKLSQTILYKELKILNDKADHLEVTTQVESKTKAYVKTYMQSRGIIYKRPVHYSISDQKNGPLE